MFSKQWPVDVQKIHWQYHTSCTYIRLCTRISLSCACLCLACLQALYLRLLFELESYITTAEINIYCSITSPLHKIHVSEKNTEVVYACIWTWNSLRLYLLVWYMYQSSLCPESCVSFSWYRGLVCGMWLWYFVVTLTGFVLFYYRLVRLLVSATFFSKRNMVVIDIMKVGFYWIILYVWGPSGIILIFTCFRICLNQCSSRKYKGWIYTYHFYWQYLFAILTSACKKLGDKGFWKWYFLIMWYISCFM